MGRKHRPEREVEAATAATAAAAAAAAVGCTSFTYSRRYIDVEEERYIDVEEEREGGTEGRREGGRASIHACIHKIKNKTTKNRQTQDTSRMEKEE
jgi:hypothetical protein